ncbi:MAG: SLC13 family permease, partial [Granulosicoccaceae bacterium]
GGISGFMQNVGAAALFIPVSSRISSRSGVPLSRILMPMGFCAILGGTLTMVGSGPLILLNDLLPEGVEKFSLFSVTPLGLLLVISGILYFVVLGDRVLPAAAAGMNNAKTSASESDAFGVDCQISWFSIAAGSALIGRTTGDIEAEYGMHIIGMGQEAPIISPDREQVISGQMQLALIASDACQSQFMALEGVSVGQPDAALQQALDAERSGLVQVVVPPDSALVGQRIRDFRIRRSYGLTPLAIHRNESIVRDGLREEVMRVGDVLLCHARWKDVRAIDAGNDFSVINRSFPKIDTKPEKLNIALGIFAITLGLVIFGDLKLSLVLMSGALAMILAGVLSLDDAYQAVSWKTVFLLAGLIPLGAAVENSGTAAWIASNTVALLGDNPAPIVIQLMVAILATLFSLGMSNVGATVVLVPLATQIALAAGADPRQLALIVGVCVSNAFLIPTHQVNALIMTPGGYRVADFVRAGGGMTVLFIVVTLIGINLFY